MAAGHNIEVDISTDHETYNYGDGEAGVRDISDTNFTDSETLIDLRGLTVKGNTNFYLKLSFSGTAENAVAMPITAELEILDG